MPPDLFGTPDPRPPTPDPRRIGRAATPRKEFERFFERKNPTGHTKIKFRYRHLHLWTDVQKRAAWALATHYAATIGGLRIVTDAVMRAIIDALAAFGDGAEEQIRWAIEAKAASLAHQPNESADTWRARRRKFLPRPENFFDPGSLGYWMEQSPDYQRHVAEVQAKHEKKMLSRAHLRKPRDPAAIKADSKQIADATIAEGRAAFKALSLASQERLMADVRAQFQSYDQHPRDMSDPTFAGCVYGRAASLARRRAAPVGLDQVRSLDPKLDGV